MPALHHLGLQDKEFAWPVAWHVATVSHLCMACQTHVMATRSGGCHCVKDAMSGRIRMILAYIEPGPGVSA